jgi:hypothetical protein
MVRYADESRVALLDCQNNVIPALFLMISISLSQKKDERAQSTVKTQIPSLRIRKARFMIWK